MEDKFEIITIFDIACFQCDSLWNIGILFGGA